MKNTISLKFLILALSSYACTNHGFENDYKSNQNGIYRVSEYTIDTRTKANIEYKILKLDDYTKSIHGIEVYQNIESIHLHYCTKVIDFSPLHNLYKVKSINLNFLTEAQINQIFCNTKNFQSVREINLSSCTLANLEFLKKFPQLKRLTLHRNTISNLSKVSACSKLEELDITYQGLSKINFIQNLTRLKSLNLANNRIEYLNSLSKLTQLKNLNISNNHIYDITNLKNLKLLKWLNLSNNRISSVESITELKKLEEINLNNNRIYDISILKQANRIKEIKLLGNLITEIPKNLHQNNCSKLSLDTENIKNARHLLYPLKNGVEINIGEALKARMKSELHEKEATRNISKKAFKKLTKCPSNYERDLSFIESL